MMEVDVGIFIIARWVHRDASFIKLQPATHRKPAMSLNSEAILRGQPGHHMSTHQKLIIAGTK